MTHTLIAIGILVLVWAYMMNTSPYTDKHGRYTERTFAQVLLLLSAVTVAVLLLIIDPLA